MATYELGISSSDAVQLYPDKTYNPGQRKIEAEIRCKSGRAYHYKWGDYLQIKFGVDFVAAGDAAVVNSWWNTNTELLFFVVSDSVVDVSSVMLRGKNKPLSNFNAPYDNYYKGKILLEGY